MRAIVARPNVCGYNAFHTSGGVLLRPSSTVGRLGAAAGRRLGVEAARRDRHRAHRLHGALGLRGLHVGQVGHDERRRRRLGLRAPRRVRVDDRVLGRRPRATGEKQGGDFWYLGPTDAQALAVLRWCRRARTRPVRAVVPVRAPAAGPVELGGWHHLGIWTNPPLDLLRDEVTPHAHFAVAQAMASPCLEIVHTAAVDLGGGTWRVEAGIANTGWLPTHVHDARRQGRADEADRRRARRRGREVVGGPAASQLGQLQGAPATRFGHGTTARRTGCWRRGSCRRPPGPR